MGASAAALAGSDSLLADDDTPDVPGIDERVRRLADEAPPAMQFRGSTVEECSQWQGRFAQQLRLLLGPHRPPEKWQTHVERVVELVDHRRHELVLTAEGCPALPVYLLTPKGDLSYGGRMTMLTAALEPRIRVAVISGALNVMQERVLGRFGCGAQIIPGLLNYGDVPEIGSLIAPRPCVWEAGLDDGLIAADWADRVLERMRWAYRAFDTEQNLNVDRFQGGHRWNGIVAYPLLDKLIVSAKDPKSAELYDLASDPSEKTNAASEHPEKVAELKAILDQRLSRRTVPRN